MMAIPESADVAPRAGLGHGAAYGVLAVALEKAVALGIALYLPRHLGLDDYGRYAFLVSYLGFFQVLPDAALEAVLVARLARAGGDGRAVAGRGALVRLAVSLAGAVIGLAVLAVLTGDAALVRAGTVGAAGLAVLAGNPYRALLRSTLRIRRYVALIAGQAAVAVGLLAMVVHAGGGLVAVLGAVSVASLAGACLGRLLVGGGVRLRADRRLGPILVGEAWPLAGTALALVGAQQVVQLLLLRLHGAAEVGLLGGAQKLVDALGLLPQAFMLSVLPALSLAAARPGRASERAREAARLLVIALLPPAAALALWAEPVLRTVLGPPFAAAAPVLRVLAPLALLGASGAVLTNLLVAVGLQRTLLAVSLGAAVALGALGGILVPAYGAVGAAVAVLLVTLAGQMALVVLPATRAHVRPVLTGVLRPGALGALAAGAAAALGASLPTGVVLLLVVYPAALIASGTVTHADLARWRA